MVERNRVSLMARSRLAAGNDLDPETSVLRSRVEAGTAQSRVAGVGGPGVEARSRPSERCRREAVIHDVRFTRYRRTSFRRDVFASFS